MLNKRVPRMHACSTPSNIFSQVVYDKFIVCQLTMNQPQCRDAKSISMTFSKPKFVRKTLDRFVKNAPNDNTAYFNSCENHTGILTRIQA